MDEYSIETRSKNIFNSKTREYFDEVFSSYQAGNYRSAVVMLWSVVVCDLLFKLEYLIDMCNDEEARRILEELSKFQERNTNSSQWELELIKLVKDKIKFLDISEYENLVHLQKQRHLSAHPIINGKKELYRPNKDTVRALIRNTLDAVLIKPPIYTKKIFDEFINDISEAEPLLIDDQKLNTYLESKYFSRMSTEVESKIFRSLWKLVFKLTNEECNQNREINYRALKLISSRNKSTVVSWVNSEKDYYSSIALNGKPVQFLVCFLSQWSKLYELFTKDAKIIIENCIKSQTKSRCLGWFIKPNLDTHYKDLLEWIESSDNLNLEKDTFREIILISDTLEWELRVNNLASYYYCKSLTYDDADKRFKQALEPLISKYNKENLLVLLERIELNKQVYERRSAKEDHKVVKLRCDEVFGKNYNYQKFPNFQNSLS